MKSPNNRFYSVFKNLLRKHQDNAIANGLQTASHMPAGSFHSMISANWYHSISSIGEMLHKFFIFSIAVVIVFGSFALAYPKSVSMVIHDTRNNIARLVNYIFDPSSKTGITHFINAPFAKKPIASYRRHGSASRIATVCINDNPRLCIFGKEREQLITSIVFYETYKTAQEASVIMSLQTSKQ